MNTNSLPASRFTAWRVHFQDGRHYIHSYIILIVLYYTIYYIMLYSFTFIIGTVWSGSSECGGILKQTVVT
jgi:hypothetical protein